jgi:hypothetical protein
MVGVATTPGAICFATYFCPAGDEEKERDTVRLALTTLRLLDPTDAGRRAGAPPDPTT